MNPIDIMQPETEVPAKISPEEEFKNMSLPEKIFFGGIGALVLVGLLLLLL